MKYYIFCTLDHTRYGVLVGKYRPARTLAKCDIQFQSTRGTPLNLPRALEWANLLLSQHHDVAAVTIERGYEGEGTN